MLRDCRKKASLYFPQKRFGVPEKPDNRRCGRLQNPCVPTLLGCKCPPSTRSRRVESAAYASGSGTLSPPSRSLTSPGLARQAGALPSISPEPRRLRGSWEQPRNLQTQSPVANPLVRASLAAESLSLVSVSLIQGWAPGSNTAKRTYLDSECLSLTVPHWLSRKRSDCTESFSPFSFSLPPPLRNSSSPLERIFELANYTKASFLQMKSRTLMVLACQAGRTELAKTAGRN